MTTPDKDSVLNPPVRCPDDTDGDNDCGKPLCPYCGTYKKMLTAVKHAPQQDLSDTPAPQRYTDNF